jgi:internalin A
LNLLKKISKMSPLKIIEVVNLQKLNLKSNQLTSLPNGIGNLMNLQKLSLFNNKLNIFSKCDW